MSIYVLLVIYLTINGFLSYLSDTSITRILRFYFILIVIPICFFVINKDFKNEWNIFLFFSVAKSIYLIVFALLMLKEGTYLPFRAWAQNNSFGDAYFVYGFLPRVQIKGNPLVLVAFIIDFVKKRRICLIDAILIVGICIAGNFAFIIGLSLAVLYVVCLKIMYDKTTIKKAIMIVTIILLMIAGIIYGMFEIQRKQNGGSNNFKIQQAKVLMNTDILIGNGLGCDVEGNLSLGRSISANYYELQTLYIFNQIGFLGLFLFYLITLFQCRLKGKEMFHLYLIYLLFTFVNPYCFDTTQMITIIVLSGV